MDSTVASPLSALLAPGMGLLLISAIPLSFRVLFTSYEATACYSNPFMLRNNSLYETFPTKSLCGFCLLSVSLTIQRINLVLLIGEAL